MVTLTFITTLLGSPAWAQSGEEPFADYNQSMGAFAEYNQAMTSGQKTKAADYLLDLLDNEELVDSHGAAWVLMGDLLDSFDMEFSALIAYANALDTNPEATTQSLKTIIDIAERLGDEALIAPGLAANVGLDVDTNTRSRMAYLAARQNFIDGSLGTATAMLMMVDAKSPTFAESEALRGVVLSHQQRFNDALVPLITAKQVGQNSDLGPRFDNMMEMNLARAYYGAGNYAEAVSSFDKVDRDSEFWPEATFERGWAHFRLDDANGALGQLHNLKTAFFDDWYFPEADLLHTYSLFLMCKFPDATRSVEEFAAEYKPVRAQLESVLGTLTPTEAWNDLNAHLAGDPTRLPVKVLIRYESEDRILEAIETVGRADDEINRLSHVRASPFAAEAEMWLKERRAQLVEEEGQRIINDAHGSKSQLDDMLHNVDITLLDMMQYEQALYEQAANTGKLKYGDPIGKLRRLSKKRGIRVWPYEGEEWADELGYYRFSARPDCPDGQQQSSGGAD